jgi:hypothetical protein
MGGIMGKLALYDIAGIQRFVYRSNKLKDIIGASSLVKLALDEYLKPLLNNESEVIFSGGGNTVIEFENRNDWQAFNKQFSRMLLVKVPGLEVRSVCEDDDKSAVEGLPKRINALYHKMAHRKDIPTDFAEVGPLPPLAKEPATDQPIICLKQGYPEEGIVSYSAARLAMREEFDRLREQDDFDKTYLSFSKIANSDFLAERGYELASDKNFMAVVHIDGNNMGRIFEESLKGAANSGDNEERLKEIIRSNSQTVHELFRKAIDGMRSQLGAFPFRAIYQNGDEITYVCHSAYALASVNQVFDQIEEQKRDLTKNSDKNQTAPEWVNKISASAGIAYVKHAFAFDKAFHFAKSCCENAKRKGRIAFGGSGSLDIGYWLDFKIIRGTVESDSLLAGSLQPMRPYCQRGPNGACPPQKYDLKALKAVLVGVKNPGNRARSGVKSLRDSLFLGGQAAVISNLASKGQAIEGDYPLEGDPGGFTCSLDRRGKLNVDGIGVNASPLFDALDLMDLEVGIW